MSAFRAGLPVTATSFVNRCGSIGLGLLPILLVQRQLPAGDAAAVMGTVRACAVVGVLLGGWVGDRWGLRASLLLSFTLAGAGLAPVPWLTSLWALAAFAGVSQLGTAMYPGAARLMLTELVPPRQHQEAIAWQRTAVNLGQVVSYAIGALAAGCGVAALLVFDAATSFMAAGLGTRMLPRPRPSSARAPSAAAAGPDATWPVFLAYGGVVAGFVFVFEMSLVAVSARCAMVFGDNGVQVFSLVMLVNTVLCALLSVPASRVLTRPGVTLPLGLALLAAGTTVALAPDPTRATFLAGSFVLTLGELVFAAVGPFVLVRVTPPGERRGSTYGWALLVQAVAKAGGSALAFPMLVHGGHPLAFLWASTLAVVALSVAGQLLRQEWLRRAPDEPGVTERAV